MGYDRLGPLEWFMNTPSHHRVHHGKNVLYLDRNHAGTLSRWKLGATVPAWQFRRADTDKDGTLDMNEYLVMVKKLFQAADKDHDGTLDRKELKSPAGRFLLRLFGPTQGPFL